MSSSGYKRGLATAAVSALAITGVPFFAGTAHANPMEEQLADGAIVLFTPDDAASVKNDGVNQTIHLVANAGSDVGQVRFEYTPASGAGAGTWNTIATVSRTDGVFSTEWAAPSAVYNRDVNIRAVAISKATGTETGAQDTNLVAVSPNADSINISNASGSELGAFQQPYTDSTADPDGAGPLTGTVQDNLLGGVQGTTSDLADNPAIELSSPSGGAGSMQEDWRETVATGDTVRDWSGPVDFSGYDWGTNTDADQALVIADLDAEDEDGEPVVLYKQNIADVTATAGKSSVPASGPGSTTSATVKVVDQKGKPVVGAQVVFDKNNNGTQDGGDEVKYTDSRGLATFSGLTGSANGSTYAFYVNTTDNNDYENGVDFRRTVTVTSYNATASTIQATSADGNAFDFDENDGDDIRVRVLDQNGAPIQGQNVSYYWTLDPFNASTPDRRIPASGDSVSATDAQGYANIQFPTDTDPTTVGDQREAGTYTLHYYVNRDGTPGQQAGDLAGSDLVVKAGQASIKWADGSVAQAQEGTTETFQGSLVLPDGTPLPNRNLNISWTPGDASRAAGYQAGNSVVAAQGSQPAGTTRTGDTSATSTTDATGKFAVALTDPAPPAAGQDDELDGTLIANTTNTPNIGNAGAAEDLEVDWLQYTGPQNADDIEVTDEELIDWMLTPGRPADLDIRVVNQEGVELTDMPVEVSVDHGFLSPDAESSAAVADDWGNDVMDDWNTGAPQGLVADPAPSQGGLFGEWKSIGTTQTFTTDDTGRTGVVVAIEDDELFDTQSTVTTTVTIKVGNVTRTIELDFTSQNPLNPGDLTIEQDDEQTVGVLPKAPTTESVWYNVFATDQFGNLVADQPIQLTDDLADAYMDGADDNQTVWSQLADENPELRLSSDVAGDQTVDGRWDAERNVWVDGDTSAAPGAAGFQEDRSRTTGNQSTDETATAETVEWYEVDFAAATYSMTDDAEDPEPVGGTVIVTYKAVDQNGEPIEGLYVEFFRAGPEEGEDGEENDWDWTDEKGEANYVFSGPVAGPATVEAIAYYDTDGDGDLDILPSSRAQSNIQFGADAPDREPIVVSLSGKGHGAGDDELFVDAPEKAEGALAKLLKRKGNGKWRMIDQDNLDSAGDADFLVVDRNGKKRTMYKVKVQRTDVTKAAVSNKRGLR